jgi:DNA-binding transcriptional LysR family regulator
VTDSVSASESDRTDEVRQEPAQPRLATDCFLKPSFTLEQIRTFLAVAAREHVTLAARALQLSQAAVTQQVQSLERALGVRLLQRVGRNVQLTDEGLEVAGACLLVMRSLENLERIARSVRGLESGSMSIGASRVAAGYYLSPTLTAFASEHPAIQLDIVVASTRDVCERIASGELECGLVDAPLPKTQLLQARVATDEVVVVAHAGHPLAGVERMTSRKLEGLRYLVWEAGSATELVAAEMLGAGYDRLTKVQLAGLEAARQSLLAGLGFATIPTLCVADQLLRGQLVRIPVAARTRPICAVRRPSPASGAVEAFWTMLTAGQVPPNGLPG